jgi:hypothetical protein
MDLLIIMKLALVFMTYMAAAISIYLQGEIEYTESIGSTQGIVVAVSIVCSLYYLLVKQSMVGFLFLLPAVGVTGWFDDSYLLSAGFNMSGELGGYSN